MLNAMQYMYVALDNLCPFGSKRNICLSLGSKVGSCHPVIIEMSRVVVHPSNFAVGRGLTGTFVIRVVVLFLCFTDASENSL